VFVSVCESVFVRVVCVCECVCACCVCCVCECVCVSVFVRVVCGGGGIFPLTKEFFVPPPPLFLFWVFSTGEGEREVDSRARRVSS
jgi:hypothetical protein